jgi:UDP-N-acetylmuramoyl-L-alanyl-D-glutamate--2,6-diaminopimelate ligase
MKLNTVLEGVKIREVIGETQREIEGIAYHSGHVKPGFLFVALRGQEVDGHRFIPDALDHGAETVVAERMEGLSGSDRTTVVLVANSRQVLAQVATNF